MTEWSALVVLLVFGIPYLYIGFLQDAFYSRVSEIHIFLNALQATCEISHVENRGALSRQISMPYVLTGLFQMEVSRGQVEVENSDAESLQQKLNAVDAVTNMLGVIACAYRSPTRESILALWTNRALVHEVLTGNWERKYLANPESRFLDEVIEGANRIGNSVNRVYA